jgi:hypothetical protein
VPGVADTNAVIKTGGIDKEARAQRIYFHGFGYGIGSSAGRCGYQCRVLPGQGIDKAGLSAVPSSKDGNVQAVGTRCIIHKSEI